MPYTRTDWRTEETPLSAGNMNNIEDGIEEALDVTRNLRENIATLALDIFYPVGSYYETSKSTSEFNPGTAWGGTWELESSGLVHVSAGTGYTLGDTGGNKDAIVPYHRHSVPALSGTATSTGHSHSVSASLPQKVAMSNGTWSSEQTSGLSGNTNRIAQIKSSDSYAYSTSVNASLSGNGAHTHPVTTVANNTGYEGVSGNTENANMQPYIVVNRWHRTA